MRRILMLIVLIIALSAITGAFFQIDRCSCICYQVTDESQERRIDQKITSVYEPREGVISLTRLTCHHRRTMWLRVFWEQGFYQIWFASA